jgi:superfamily II DNA or RNA helicase
MSRNPISTAPSPTRSAFRPTFETRSRPWPAIRAEALVAVREPAEWAFTPGPCRAVRDLAPTLRLGLVGVAPDGWEPPGWLHPHQADAARRLATALRVFGGALLGDAVGLGKSFVALALATRYPTTTLAVPAALRGQWRDLAARWGLAPRLVSHEALSRGARVPRAALLVVDEAHRFRDSTTRRYDTLARQVGGSDVLLVTATPVVNRATDLVHLLRLFLADHALATLGIPSLEAAGAGAPEELLHGIAPLTVARSPETARPPTPLPVIRGSRVIRAPPTDEALLPLLVRAIGRLRFPAFGPDVSPLLRRHLLARLASSPEACGESVRRHRAYLTRAADAARRGERLGRAAARALFGADDAGQLELLLGSGATPRGVASRALERERARLDQLDTLLRQVTSSPKAAACVALIRRRAARKTIVFTSARATARALAAALGWRRVAVVAGRRAEIASGRFAASDAFGLFAPRAQGREAPPATLRLDTLIATDVAAEGLNLQDADGVVHFDLPWTPLALEQRVGRARRLGSAHRAVRVWWFAPAPPLERRLGITARIDGKAAVQLALGAPRTAAVGRASVVGGPLDRREAMIAGVREPVCGHAFTTGLDTPLAVLHWRGPHGDVYQVVASGVRALPVDAVADALACTDGEARGRQQPDVSWAAARLRERVTAAESSPRHAAVRQLARRILTRARTAARDRRFTVLAQLDQTLQRLAAGVPVGAERCLADAMDGDRDDAFGAWCARWPGGRPTLGDPHIVALIEPLGDAKPG